MRLSDIAGTAKPPPRTKNLVIDHCRIAETSGRVRMHKARENNDGTFSIGKTWMLDDRRNTVV